MRTAAIAHGIWGEACEVPFPATIERFAVLTVLVDCDCVYSPLKLPWWEGLTLPLLALQLKIVDPWRPVRARGLVDLGADS